MDGTALVNMIKSSVQEKTFAEYASNTFALYVSALLQHVKRIDIVWDEYVDASLKATTRHKRGQGVLQRVAPGNKLPRNWMEFLRNGRNKQELFRLLAQCTASIHSGEKQVGSSYGQGVLSTLLLEDVSRFSTPAGWRLLEYSPTVIIYYKATHALGKRKVAKQENTNMPRSLKFFSRQKIQV